MNWNDKWNNNIMQCSGLNIYNSSIANVGLILAALWHSPGSRWLWIKHKLDKVNQKMYIYKTIFLIKSSLLRTINTTKNINDVGLEGEEAKTHCVIIVVFQIIAGPRRIGAQIHQQEAPHCPQKNWSLLSSANLHSEFCLSNPTWAGFILYLPYTHPHSHWSPGTGQYLPGQLTWP